MRTDADDKLMLPALRKYSLISYVPGALKTSVIDTGTGFFSISSSSSRRRVRQQTYCPLDTPSTDILPDTLMPIVPPSVPFSIAAAIESVASAM